MNEKCVFCFSFPVLDLLFIYLATGVCQRDVAHMIVIVGDRRPVTNDLAY